ncbi:Arabinose efflux permease [Hoeflea phototrophica DFL-43]|jgi:MFS family permease|uniref:Arabinose efflux permease n=1 Tax=Hoeflea phototrophica (strain DSM 17068 / NCIMB 14078 / DFL-43) TaxID=411684 RepID=A9D197_HOEPD|nr:MFS transporter [Hoeflea phototrophica]EDQ34403.1 Arabinose efflux permease [Hoeflea phototrophica DFL-43]
MHRNLFPVLSLLLGTAFLLAGNGLHGLLLPMRGTEEGFSPTSLGLLGTAWATGFVLGCIFSQRLVRRIGHVRAFSAFSAMIAIIALLTGLLVDPVSWIILRVVTGFSLAAAFMIIESWLNERATNETRGLIFSLYMTVTYVAIVTGQMSIALGDVKQTTFFMIAGILYCLALLPTAVSTATSPAPLKEVRIDLKLIYRNSPVSFVAMLMIGIANGAFGTLAPVFGANVGLETITIATMMSVTIFSGALMQIPAGRMSDRMDRRYMLAGLAAIAGVSGLAIVIIKPEDVGILFGLIALYGAMSYTLYSIIVAHANDFAESDQFVTISSGLLLLYGIGTIIGPLISGLTMAYSPYLLFAVTAVSHLAVTAYAVFRSFVRAAVPDEEKETFASTPSARSATPESINLDPRATTSED